MNYRKITTRVADCLKPLQAYIYLGLAMKSDYETLYSNVNEDTLAEYLDVHSNTISKNILYFQREGLIHINRQNYPDKRKNSYQLNGEHYVLIDEQLLREPISRELKGFLVLLKCRCLNSTNVCLYSGRKLADTLCLKKSRVNYYLNQAEELGYIKRKRNTITLTRDDIFIVTNETDIAQWRRFYPEVILDEDFDEHGKYIGHD